MPKKKKVLIADDTELNRALLGDILSGKYSILEAKDGREVMETLSRHYTEISLVLLDIRMPNLDGFGVLKEMAESPEHYLDLIPVVVISSESTPEFIDHAYDLGATDYIPRPFDENVVARRVENTIKLYMKRNEMAEVAAIQMVAREHTNAQMVDVLSNIVEFRNGESGLHVIHIRTLTRNLLQELRRQDPSLGLDDDRIGLITVASAMHDIGKIAIDANILNKPGRLTTEEFAIMKTHTTIGAQMLRQLPTNHNADLLHVAHDICRWHHERWDGSGYPDGLKGDDIPIAAQVVALADVYDALTSERVYKPAFSHEKAVSMILTGECGAFSPKMRRCFQALCRDPENLMIEPAEQSEIEELRRALIKINKSEGPQISSHTINLLEQEREKYHFYASMTQEILFEYDKASKVLSFSEWGSTYLNVPTLIQNPLQDIQVQEWGKDAAEDVAARLAKATPEVPIVSGSYCLQIKGAPRWFRVVARPLWDGDKEDSVYSRIIGKLIDIHEDQIRLNELEVMATRDPLTNLFNHKTARKLIEKEIMARPNDPCLFMLLDIDNFKSANDTYGHAFGDKVLKFVAKRINTSTRSEDISARIGGDEFLIFMRYKSEAERLVYRVFSDLTMPYDNFSVKLSLGVSLYPHNGTDYDLLLRRADTALYDAKRRGKNMVSFYNEQITDFPVQRTPIDNPASNQDG